MKDILVNRSSADQRVSGQQRYAAEIAAQLSGRSGFDAARPRGVWARSTLWTWVWVQLILPVTARGRVLLSMTARAPLWCRRHVLVIHDLFVLEHPEWFSRSYVWTHALLLRAQIRGAAAVIAVSEPVAEQIRAMRSDEVAVAANAPSEVFAASDDAPSAVLREHGIEPGSYLMAVGNKDPRKNLAGLAAAYARLPESSRLDHPLILVGGSAAIYRDQVITWPTGAVQAGYVDDDELRRLYRDARTVVFVSLAEGFGLPLVEAGAAGARSFVLSDLEVFRWIVGDGARYVDPTSPTDIADGLEKELADRSEVDLDLERFTWAGSAAVVARVCEAVAGGRR